MKSHQLGFTLAEAAVVMVIIALVLGGLITTLPNQINTQRVSNTQARLLEMQEALIGYAISRPNGAYLPCPATTIAGTEGVRNAAGACPQQEGWLPWTTLGLSTSDGWNNRIRYRVDARFSDSSIPAAPAPNIIDLADVANLRVCSAPSGAPTCPGNTTIAANLPVVLIAHGGNGFGARNEAFALQPQPAGAHELANTDGRNATDTTTNNCPLSPANPNTACTFVSHEPRATGGTGGEFDDVVSWLPANILFARLVAAGKLP